MSTHRERVTVEAVASDRLEMRVVEYPDAPDRCTLYPPELDDHERMTHWLSADREAFRSLELHR